MREESVLIAGRLAGTVSEHPDRVRSFRYDPSYDGPDLSLSMPLGAAPWFGDEAITPWLEGLLPDNPLVRADLADRARCRPGDTLAILERYGLDLPGAVQVVPPGSEGEAGGQGGSYSPISEREIGRRLELAQDSSRPSWEGDEERWSLGGNQGKTALALLGGEWYVCEGSAPTTHILKPGVVGFDDEALDEYACMRLAAHVGLDAAEVGFREFGGVPAIVVARYDRVALADGSVARLHQEDLCQALGYLPADKYLPTATEVAGALSGAGGGDSVGRFLDALLFNYLIGATDAHAKNYSVIHFSDGRFVLAPLYDVASILPYRRAPNRARRAAMSIGRCNEFGRLCGSNLDRLARNVGDNPASLRERLSSIAGGIVERMPEALDDAARAGAGPAFLESFGRTIVANCTAALENVERDGRTCDLSFLSAIDGGTLARPHLEPVSKPRQGQGHAGTGERPSGPHQ